MSSLYGYGHFMDSFSWSVLVVVVSDNTTEFFFQSITACMLGNKRTRSSTEDRLLGENFSLQCNIPIDVLANLWYLLTRHVYFS